jgi:hypothetical protein
MSTRDSHTLLLTPLAAFMPPCETALLLAQVPQASLIVFGVGDLLSGGESRQICKAEIYPYQVALAWAQGAGNFRTEAHVVCSPRITREGDHVGTLDHGKLFSEFHNPELGQTQHPRAPGGTDILKAKALAAALGPETGIACTPHKEAAEGAILIPQALRQGRCRHLGQPLMPCRALPLREPP